MKNNPVYFSLLMIVHILIGCSDNSFFFQDEPDGNILEEIAFSTEYKDFLHAHYNFYLNANFFKDEESLIEITDDCNYYDKATKRLKNKYPQFFSYDVDVRNAILALCAKEDEDIANMSKDDLKRNNKITRSSNSNFEYAQLAYILMMSDPTALSKCDGLMYFSTLPDAFNQCRSISNKETGGYLFSDNSCLWMNTKASWYRQFIPVLDPLNYNYPEGAYISAVFHCHVDDSWPSDGDVTAAQQLVEQTDVNTVYVTTMDGRTYLYSHPNNGN